MNVLHHTLQNKLAENMKIQISHNQDQNCDYQNFQSPKDQKTNQNPESSVVDFEKIQNLSFENLEAADSSDNNDDEFSHTDVDQCSWTQDPDEIPCQQNLPEQQQQGQNPKRYRFYSFDEPMNILGKYFSKEELKSRFEELIYKFDQLNAQNFTLYRYKQEYEKLEIENKNGLINQVKLGQENFRLKKQLLEIKDMFAGSKVESDYVIIKPSPQLLKFLLGQEDFSYNKENIRNNNEAYDNCYKV